MDRKKDILSIYAMVSVGAIMMLIPYSLIPFAGFAAMTVGFLSAYIYRARAKDNIVLKEHMTRVIRTVWWSNLILLVAVIAFCSIIVSNGDLSMINALMNSAEKGVLPTESDIQAMQIDFVKTNIMLIGWTAMFTLSAYPIYILFHMVKGARLLTKK
jgi:uncharacterized membrane protein